MTDVIYPYTYLVGWPSQDRWYYGVRYAKGCHPDELWKSYFTSSKYVKMCRALHGEPPVVEVRKVFKTKKAAIDWEHRVLRRMKVMDQIKWLNATINMAPHAFVRKHNPIPGILAAQKKTKGKTYEEIVGTTKAAELKERRSKWSSDLWNDPTMRERMRKKPSDTSAYRACAIKRHSDPEYKKRHSEAVKKSWLKRKGLA